MKPYVNKKITKNLIIIFVFMIITNTLLPNFVQAKLDTESGGGLLAPLEQFIVFLCDKVMQWLQNTFTSNQSIDRGDGIYNFQYSPAIIFSGTVPALDINFIEPNEDVRNSNNYGKYVEDNIMQFFYDKNDDSTGYENAKTNFNNNNLYYYIEGGLIGPANASYQAYYWVENDTLYIECMFDNGAGVYITGSRYEYYSTSFSINDPEVQGALGEISYSSTAQKLQKTIATWYKALRRIALVGLLSVLVYIGIRMVMTSASQEKAKYKKMMVDWLVALCLLFTLHYIMSITLTITQEISNVFETGETDELLNKLRGEVRSGDSWGEVLAKTIMYVVLVIYTVTFTFRYIKRVIYMAFYTLIAPLITLTYPLDKIKDGQAQAFNMWIKEYVFTALIQVVHLVIYSVLVGSAIELVNNYEIYAIIVIMFIKQAEDTIKKMFGFDKSETVGTLGAAATGGLLMSAINKMKTPPKTQGGKSGGADGGESKGVRTVSSDPLASLQGGGTPSAPTPSTQTPSTQAPSTQTPSTQAPSTPTPSTQTPGTPARTSSKPTRNIGSGIWKVAGRYTRPIASKGAGLLVGGAGAMVGFAAGVAQGDFGAAATGLLAGGKAGYYTGQKGVNGIANIKNARQHLENFTDTWREGAYGEEYAQNVKFDREFKRGDAYKRLKQQWSSDPNFDTNVHAMLNAGITEKSAMEKILKNNNNNIADAIGYYTLAKKCPDSVYYDDNKLQQFLQDLGLSQTDANTMRQNMKKYR